MHTTYAIVWRNGDEPVEAGKLELRADGIFLEGGNGVRDVLEIPYEDLAALAIGRTAQDRLEGRPTLVLERRGGSRVAIAGVAQPGVVSELVERLATIAGRPHFAGSAYSRAADDVADGAKALAP